MTVRTATLDDVPAILRLVYALAEYEKQPEAVEATEAHFRKALFPREGVPSVFCHVAEVGEDIIGMAIWCNNFSTWTGRQGIWLEDLFVLPEYRAHGVGKQLLGELARLCVEHKWARLEWSVLDWNEPSIGFYRSLGAGSMEDWTTYRLTGEALTRLGARETETAS